MTAFPSPNHGARRGGVAPSLIVLHYTGMATYAEARARLCDPLHEVSAHWLLSDEGEAEALVDEGQRAWHAGAGSWGAVTDINSASIGVEMQNPGDRPYPQAQMAGLERLLTGIMARWGIGAAGVIGHSDMAPTRKRDPGPRFDWRRLALQGMSVWPVAQEAPVAAFYGALRRFGYGDGPEADVLTAFRLRFRPMVTGPVDAVDAGAAVDLARRYGTGQ